MLFWTQFRWCGRVIRMPDERIPKRLLYSQLPNAKCHPSGQQKRYKDQLRVSLRACEIDRTKWEEQATDRSDWRDLCYNAVNQFQEQRIECAKNGRAMRKACSSANTTSTLQLPVYLLHMWTWLFIPERLIQQQMPLLTFIMLMTQSITILHCVSKKSSHL